jgi:hypothetical protein
MQSSDSSISKLNPDDFSNLDCCGWGVGSLRKHAGEIHREKSHVYTPVKPPFGNACSFDVRTDVFDRFSLFCRAQVATTVVENRNDRTENLPEAACPQ